VSKQPLPVWMNALGMLRREIGADMLPIFLAQLGSPLYTSWHIGALWKMPPREVTSYRRALCEDTKTLIPEVRHIAADVSLIQVHRKERVA